MSVEENRKIKRPRLILSCVECRRRKLKCDKAESQCNNCRRSGRACVYNTGIRDTKTGGVIRLGDENHAPEEALSETLSNHASSREREGLPNTKSGDKAPQTPGFLSVQRGGRLRYIDQTFWGLLNGQQSLSEELLCESKNILPNMPPGNMALGDLAMCLHSIPTRPVSDIFIKSFFICIYPVCPLLERSTFQTEYESFWKWLWNADGNAPQTLVEDPTFICLLFAMLHSGACTVPEEEWGASPLKPLQRNETINRLSQCCSKSLDACNFTEHPTLHALVASILLHEFAEKSIKSAVCVSSIIRLAQGMGFHQEIEPLQMPRQVQRAIWWHLVWLDIRTTLITGLPPLCGKESLDDVEQVSIYHDNRNSPEINLTEGKETMDSNHSLVMLYANGRFETARFHRLLFSHLQGGNKIPQGSIFDLSEDAKQLRLRIDSLIASIPTRGLPEKGMIPSDLTNASPSKSLELYEDEIKQPNVLGAWVRIMLSLLKLEIVITLQKSILEPFSTGEPAKLSWKNIAKLCLNYLETFLHLVKTPAFEPYSWFFSQKHDPQQSVFLILSYIGNEETRLEIDQESKQAMLYCVDELIRFWTSKLQLEKPTFKVITRLRSELNSMKEA